METNEVRLLVYTAIHNGFEELKKRELAYQESGGSPAMRLKILNEFFKTADINTSYGQLVNHFRLIEANFEDADDDILNFPQTLFSPKEDQGECSICMENFKEGDMTVKLECGHNFHMNCITEWSRKKKSCPFCRSRIVQADPTIPLRLICMILVVYNFIRAAIDTGIVSTTEGPESIFSFE